MSARASAVSCVVLSCIVVLCGCAGPSGAPTPAPVAAGLVTPTPAPTAAPPSAEDARPPAANGVLGTTIDLRAQLPEGAAPVAALDVASAHGHRFALGDRANDLVLRALVWTTHMPAEDDGYEEPVLAGIGFEVLENPNHVHVRWASDQANAAGAHVSVHIQWDTQNGGIAGLDFVGTIMAHTPDGFFEDDD